MAHHGDTERRQPNTERSGNTALTLGARRQAAQKGNLPALQRGDSASGRRRKSERHSCRPRPTDTRVYRYFTPQFRLNDDQLVRLPEQQCHIKRRETAVRNEPARWLPFLLQLERGRRRRPTGSIGRFRPTLRAHKQAGPARKEKQAGEKAAAAARASLLEPSGDGHGPAAMNAPSLQACSAHKRFINFFFPHFPVSFSLPPPVHHPRFRYPLSPRIAQRRERGPAGRSMAAARAAPRIRRTEELRPTRCLQWPREGQRERARSAGSAAQQRLGASAHFASTLPSPASLAGYFCPAERANGASATRAHTPVQSRPRSMKRRKRKEKNMPYLHTAEKTTRTGVSQQEKHTPLNSIVRLIWPF